MQLKNKNYIYLSNPHLSGEEIVYINKALKDNWVAPLGPNVDGFEADLIKYLNVNYSCALNSGTAALHLALKVIGIKQNDKVLCNSFTFSASANVIAYEKAQPIFIDSDPTYWTVNIELLEEALKKYKPRAFICVNIYGQCPDYDKIVYLCNAYNTVLIEDAAESLGSEYKDKKSGSFGHLSILSFNGNKIITTSGGGALMSDDEKLILHAKKLSTQSREKVIHYEHKEIGYNYRLSNILAGIGRAQLLVLDERVKRKREIFDKYIEELSDIDNIQFLTEGKNIISNRWLTTLKFKSNQKLVYSIINALEKENIESRPLWKPMHMQPIFKSCKYVKGSKDVSRSLFETGLCLPSSTTMNESDQDKVISIMRNIL
jgi:pyridoxal phosphate-dependent aminotransferase EpsN